MSAAGAAAWSAGGAGEGVEPGVDLALVGVGELEGQEEALGGDAADAPALERSMLAWVSSLANPWVPSEALPSLPWSFCHSGLP